MEQTFIGRDADPVETAAVPVGPDHPQPFVGEAEADAYWQGVADGIRQLGGSVPPRLAARAAPDGLLNLAAAPDPDDILAFDPVAVRGRHDGWTPEKQAAFVEALAETGIVRAAAARVGMSEQGYHRLRRRADARSFDIACRAAERMGRRRLTSIAYERAIEGTIKRRYYRGELLAEERVYDNRLLVALINRLPPEPDDDAEADHVERHWEAWIDAIATGDAPPEHQPEADPEPEPEPAPAPAFAANPRAAPSVASATATAPAFAGSAPARPESLATESPFGIHVREDGGTLITNAPPPAGYDHREADFEPGHRWYARQITIDEELWWEETGCAQAHEVADMGEPVWLLHRPTFFPWGTEPLEPFDESAELEDEESEASSPSGESRTGAADGSA